MWLIRLVLLHVLLQTETSSGAETPTGNVLPSMTYKGRFTEVHRSGNEFSDLIKAFIDRNMHYRNLRTEGSLTLIGNESPTPSNDGALDSQDVDDLEPEDDDSSQAFEDYELDVGNRIGNVLSNFTVDSHILLDDDESSYLENENKMSDEDEISDSYEEEENEDPLTFRSFSVSKGSEFHKNKGQGAKVLQEHDVVTGHRTGSIHGNFTVDKSINTFDSVGSKYLDNENKTDNEYEISVDDVNTTDEIETISNASKSNAFKTNTFLCILLLTIQFYLTKYYLY